MAAERHLRQWEKSKWKNLQMKNAQKNASGMNGKKANMIVL